MLRRTPAARRLGAPIRCVLVPTALLVIGQAMSGCGTYRRQRMSRSPDHLIKMTVVRLLEPVPAEEVAVRTEDALSYLERELTSKSGDKRALAISRLRRDVIGITSTDENCAIWARDYVIESLHTLLREKESDAVIGAAPGPKMTPSAKVAARPSPSGSKSISSVCPTGGRLAAGAFLMPGFSAYAASRPVATIAGQKETRPVEVVAGGPGLFFVHLGEERCEEETLSVYGSGGLQYVQTIRASFSLDKACASVAEEMYRANLAECNPDCCKFEDAATCREEKCAAECRDRQGSLPPAHPAVEEACDESGSYFTWCRDVYCGANLVTCRDKWCTSGSGAKASCVREARAAHALARDACRPEACRREQD